MTLKTITSKGLIGDILAVFAGMLLTLSFAPFEFYPAAIISPAILLALWLNISKKRAFLRGWLYGIGLFSTGVYWVYISIYVYGDTPWWFALGITAGFVAILALFPALTGYFLNRFFPRTQLIKLVCAFPAIWVLLEWIRSWIFTGFPWLLIGYSQINSPLRNYASLGSVFLVSIMTLISAGFVLNLFLQLRQKQFKQSYLSLLGFAVLWVIGAALSFPVWTKGAGNPIQVSLVQGNIPQSIKWSPDSILPTLQRYTQLSKPHWQNQLVIWPESAIPIPILTARNFLIDIDQYANNLHAGFITGIPIEVPHTDNYYNAVIGLGNAKGMYLKQRLVPFGEFVPLQRYLGKLFDMLQVPMSDFVSGQKQPLIQYNHLNIATYICYEIAFPEQVRTSENNINILLTVSNDAWFGESIAQAQHLEMAQMRAIEMGRPILFVSNNGLTATIDAFGKIQKIAPPFQPYVLTDTVQPTQGQTPWQIIGFDPELLGCMILLIIAIRKRI